MTSYVEKEFFAVVVGGGSGREEEENKPFLESSLLYNMKCLARSNHTNQQTEEESDFTLCCLTRLEGG